MSDNPGPAPSSSASTNGGGLLNLIEKVGNKLPDPATLFLLGTIFVMLISWVAAEQDWTVTEERPFQVMEEVVLEDGTVVEQPAHDENGDAVIEWRATGRAFTATSLLSRDGLDWAISSMVENFINFAPLGVVLVGMLGIGVAERTGLIAVILKAFMVVVPKFLLTPAMVFMGIMSSMTLDAGYVVLPPLAAALYKAVGRSPLAGLAAVFAGVAAGFNANLFITGLEPMLAEFATLGAQVIDPDYAVNPACNWWFMIASTFVITMAGWATTALCVERRLSRKPPEDGGPKPPTKDELEEQRIKSEELKSAGVAAGAFAVVMAIILGMILIPGAPLYTFKMPDPAAIAHNQKILEKAEAKGVDPTTVGYERPEELKRIIAEVWEPSFPGETPPENAVERNGRWLVPSDRHFDRWVDAIVPLLFFIFIVPALAYGVAIGTLKNDKDVAKLLIESMAAMAPIIVLAFFAAQFIEYFGYSGLDTMLAMAGGQWLGHRDMPPHLLILAFIGMTMVFNLFIGSMSAKYAMFAPIFIPMFMMVGISPELTQVAYRIGDSVTNIITPLNAYLIIILVFMQKYVPKGGMGTLISTMLPYTIVFTIVWSIMLLIWMGMGWDLGVQGGLEYVPPAP